MSTQELALKDTKITDFSVNPPRPVVGQTVEIRGRIEEHELVCTWHGMPSAYPVRLVVNGEVVDEARADGEGRFAFYWTPPAPGTYYIRAEFPGDFWHNPSSSTTERVEVITQEQKEEEERQRMLMLGIGVLGAAIVASSIAIAYITTRR